MSSDQVGAWAEVAKLAQTKSRKQNGRRQCMVIRLWFQCTAHPVILQLFWPVCHTHNPLLLGMRSTSIRSQHLDPRPPPQRRGPQHPPPHPLPRPLIFSTLLLPQSINHVYLHPRSKRTRAISSVGSEHLPYKQGVAGSNPASPTTKKTPSAQRWVFLFMGQPSAA